MRDAAMQARLTGAGMIAGGDGWQSGIAGTGLRAGAWSGENSWERLCGEGWPTHTGVRAGGDGRSEHAWQAQGDCRRARAPAAGRSPNSDSRHGQRSSRVPKPLAGSTRTWDRAPKRRRIEVAADVRDLAAAACAAVRRRGPRPAAAAHRRIASRQCERVGRECDACLRLRSMPAAPASRAWAQAGPLHHLAEGRRPRATASPATLLPSNNAQNTNASKHKPPCGVHDTPKPPAQPARGACACGCPAGTGVRGTVHACARQCQSLGGTCRPSPPLTCGLCPLPGEAGVSPVALSHVLTSPSPCPARHDWRGPTAGPDARLSALQEQPRGPPAHPPGPVRRHAAQHRDRLLAPRRLAAAAAGSGGVRRERQHWVAKGPLLFFCLGPRRWCPWSQGPRLSRPGSSRAYAPLVGQTTRGHPFRRTVRARAQGSRQGRSPGGERSEAVCAGKVGCLCRST